MSNGNQMLPIREEIVRRAYELYVAGGRQNGGDVDDWLTAEKELQGQLLRRSGSPIWEGKVEELPNALSEDSSVLRILRRRVMEVFGGLGISWVLIRNAD